MRDFIHPCIIKMIDAYSTTTHLYIRMEYMAGGSLRERLNRDDVLTEDQSKFFMYQLANAVAYMHARGVAYRDIKPGNIMLATNYDYPRIKLIDFGISKSTEQMLSVVGSTMYFVIVTVIIITV